ncbi:MAG: M15 family metallopeptidase [Candidatus Paceibacterota bacterium]
MRNLIRKITQAHPFVLGTTISGIVFIGLFLYAYIQIFELQERTAFLDEEIERKTAALADATHQLASGISTLDEKAEGISSTLSGTQEEIRSTRENFDEQVAKVSNTVGTLEKLSKTDPELLQKYSKVFFLNEHYSPERIFEVPNEYKYFERRSYVVHEVIWPKLQKMIDDAKSEGHELYVYSAYRSFDEQNALKESYKVTYGEGTANQFSADQGYSEHQLGTAVDLITTGIGGTLEGFEGTEEYEWLAQNAHEYGFTLSYPEGNSYYVFEPWHWRYVGTELATHLKDTGQHFYDLPQREIDEYLVSLFD